MQKLTVLPSDFTNSCAEKFDKFFKYNIFLAEEKHMSCRSLLKWLPMFWSGMFMFSASMAGLSGQWRQSRWFTAAWISIALMFVSIALLIINHI